MKKYILFLSLIMIVFQTQSQHLQPLANGLKINTFYHPQGVNYYLNTMDENNFVYNVFYDTITSNFNIGKEYSQVRLQIYNGFTWLFSPPIKLYSLYSIDAPRVLCVKSFDGSIYIGGAFDSTDIGPHSGIVKFNGVKWETAGIQIINSITESVVVTKMEIYNGGMMLVGDFDSIPNNKVNGLLNFDGQEWKGVGLGTNWGLNGTSTIYNLNFRTINDTLFVFIKDKTPLDSIHIAGVKVAKCGFIDNLQLKHQADFKEQISELLSFNKRIIYLLSSPLLYVKNLKFYKNNQWQIVAMSDSFYATNYLGFLDNGQMLYLFFQNPLNPSIDMYEFNGETIKKTQTWHHSTAYISLSFIKNNSVAYISGNFDIIRKNQSIESYQRIANFDPSINTVVTCLAFHDLNNDLIKQMNEPYLENAIIYESIQSLLTNTNVLGTANFYLKTLQACEFKANSYQGLKSNQTYAINPSTDSIYYFEFPYSNANFNDVSLNLFSNTANLIKIGQETFYTLKVANSSDEVKIVNIRVKHPAKTRNFVFDNFSLLILQKQKDNFVFSDQLLPHQSKNYQFRCYFDRDSFSINDKIELDASFLSQQSSTNHQDVFEQTVVESMQSNLKVATPNVVANAQKQIKYHIYFQNTSADTVLNVTVVDTFGSLLDLRKVVIGGASHGYIYSIQNNVFIWHFNQIKLPPFQKDSLKSRGFVSFTSYINNQAKIGDTIFNKAAVFYDYQKPKITNFAKVYVKKETSLIDKEINIGLNGYPNPTDGKLTIENGQNAKIEIYDFRGRLITVVNTNENGEMQMPDELSNGLYLLKQQNKEAAFYKVILCR
ncbi:MAG: T9SS type A sorting domain-containing protein [Bacteroidota bacterium]|nr:T9SS type A sorting domain-containing protein [Bacteroidota bacterium]